MEPINIIRLKDYSSEVRAALDALDYERIIRASEVIYGNGCDGATIWTLGNGHGASVAEAFALDLVKHSGVNAVSMTSFPMLSAYANDHKFVDAFSLYSARILKAFDVLVGFTFGGSENILSALRYLSDCFTILITSAGKGADGIDLVINVPSHDIQVVEDIWSSIGHMIANEVKSRIENG